MTKQNKILKEIRRMIILSIYFSVFFLAIIYFRFSILQQAQLPYTACWLGIIKAIVCTKFLMISQAVSPVKITHNKPLIGYIISRSILYVLLVTLLTVIEESIMAKIHGKHILDSITGIQHGTINVFLSSEILYWFMVLPYVIYVALDQYLGEKKLNNIFFGNK